MDDVKSAAQLQVNAPSTEKTWRRGWVGLVVKRKMAEQSAEHLTRFTTNYCLKTWQEDNSTDNISYLEYIFRPERPFIF